MTATVLLGDENIVESASRPIDAKKLKHAYQETLFIDRDITGRPRTKQVNLGAKVGGTAGFAVAGANNLPYLATLPASQTGSKLVIPITGLEIGEIITGFKIVAQIESAGGAVTLDAELRATTNVAAEPTDAIIGSAMTQVSVTADTAVAQEKTGLSETVTSGKSYYLLLTGTTAAATDIIVQACEITTTDNVVPRTRTIFLFVADKAGTIEEVQAGMEEYGTSTSITVDVQKRPATSILTSAIALTHAVTDRAEVEGTLNGSNAAYAAGDVFAVVVTVTTAVGCYGLWVRIRRLENGI